MLTDHEARIKKLESSNNQFNEKKEELTNKIKDTIIIEESKINIKKPELNQGGLNEINR